MRFCKHAKGKKSTIEARIVVYITYLEARSQVSWLRRVVRRSVVVAVSCEPSLMRWRLAARRRDGDGNGDDGLNYIQTNEILEYLYDFSQLRPMSPQRFTPTSPLDVTSPHKFAGRSPKFDCKMAARGRRPAHPMPAGGSENDVSKRTG